VTAPYEPYNPLDMNSIAESVVRELLNQPCVEFPPPAKFRGAGVYALYYRGDFPAYRRIAERNANGCEMPIYVGRAEPEGARKGLNVVAGAATQKLYNRLHQHAKSIRAATNLNVSHFRCRYRVVEDLFVPLAERRLIEEFKPVWNILLDGFGLHDPGGGRYAGARSPWDEVHPGRKWYDKLKANERTSEEWSERIVAFIADVERGVITEVPVLDDGEVVEAEEEDTEGDSGE